MSFSFEEASITQKLNVCTNRRKAAANNMQLLQNRIFLLQKEEDRAKRRIRQTKARAQEILNQREESIRLQQNCILLANSEVEELHFLQERNKCREDLLRKSLELKSKQVQSKKKESASEVKSVKASVAERLSYEREQELLSKKKKRDQIRQREEEARIKREEMKKRQDEKVKLAYQQKLEQEEVAVREAERLVHELEESERLHILRLQMTQNTQDKILSRLEELVVTASSSLSSHTV